MLRPVDVLFWSSFLSSPLAAAAADRVKSVGSCRFAPAYTCDDFSNSSTVNEYLSSVMKWEGNFARANVGYDAFTGNVIM